MTWLTENWIWILFGMAFIAMHLFGRRGHGGHGGHVGWCGHGRHGSAVDGDGHVVRTADDSAQGKLPGGTCGGRESHPH